LFFSSANCRKVGHPRNGGPDTLRHRTPDYRGPSHLEQQRPIGRIRCRSSGFSRAIAPLKTGTQGSPCLNPPRGGHCPRVDGVLTLAIMLAISHSQTVSRNRRVKEVNRRLVQGRLLQESNGVFGGMELEEARRHVL